MKALNKNMNFKNTMQENIEAYEKHPFLIKANNNTLDKEQLIAWIMCAGRESQAFPEIIKNMIEWVGHNKIKEVLINNLNDECGDGNPKEAHFMHYIQLLEKINLTKEDFLSYDSKAGVDFAISLAYNISETKDPGLVLGYMLINEALTPVIYSAVQKSMKFYYPNLDTNFFNIHIEVDEQHVADLFRAVDCLNIKENQSVKFGIDLGLRGMSVILDESLGVFNSIKKIPKLSLNN